MVKLPPGCGTAVFCGPVAAAADEVELLPPEEPEEPELPEEHAATAAAQSRTAAIATLARPAGW
jgi:hypothetical protein